MGSGCGLGRGVVDADGLGDLVDVGYDEAELHVGEFAQLGGDVRGVVGWDGDDELLTHAADGDDAEAAGGVSGDHGRGLGVYTEFFEVDHLDLGEELIAPGLPDMFGSAEAPGEGDFTKAVLGGALLFEDFVDVVTAEVNETT